MSPSSRLRAAKPPSSPVQAALPTFEGALVEGPLFVRIELPGDPRPWPRARARIITPRSKPPFISFYVDSETAGYKKALEHLATILMRRRPPTERPLALLLEVYKRIPESWPARDREAALSGRMLPTSKPDADNFLKIVDALNGVVWKDDAQVIDAVVRKRYSSHPRLVIEVREFVAPTDSGENSAAPGWRCARDSR